MARNCLDHPSQSRFRLLGWVRLVTQPFSGLVRLAIGHDFENVGSAIDVFVPESVARDAEIDRGCCVILHVGPPPSDWYGRVTEEAYRTGYYATECLVVPRELESPLEFLLVSADRKTLGLVQPLPVPAGTGA